MDKKSLYIGMLVGFMIGVILTGIVIEYFVIKLVESIPSGIVENMNTTIVFNETKLVEAMNQSGAFIPK